MNRTTFWDFCSVLWCFGAVVTELVLVSNKHFQHGKLFTSFFFKLSCEAQCYGSHFQQVSNMRLASCSFAVYALVPAPVFAVLLLYLNFTVLLVIRDILAILF